MRTVTWKPVGEDVETATIGVAKAKVYAVDREAGVVWLAEVTGDVEPTEHPTRYTAKLAAAHRIWAVLGDPS